MQSTNSRHTFALAIASAFCAVLVSSAALAEPQSESGAVTPATETEDKAALAKQLADAMLPQLVGRALEPAVVFGAQICLLQGQVKVWQESIAYEREIGKASGVVNMEDLHGYGEALVDTRKELEQAKTTAKRHSVKPAPCSHPHVAKLTSCNREQDEHCRKFEQKLETIIASSVSAHRANDTGKEGIEQARALLGEKHPDVLAELDARVAAVLAWLRGAGR